MERRRFLLGSAALAINGSLLGISNVLARPAPNVDKILRKTMTGSTQGIDAVAEIKKLQIPTGPYAGGFEIAPNGKFNWYFANLGLIAIIQYLGPNDLSNYILNYLNLYLRSLDPQGVVKDVEFPYGRSNTNAFNVVRSDSDDSYAATFLSLAVRYAKASQNWTWWDANKATLKAIAYRNICAMQKSSGMTRTFQVTDTPYGALSYLMDNCEAYRGLRDFASMLRDRGDLADADYHDLCASRIVAAISQTMYDTARGGFMTSDGDSQATTAFYAGTTCQIFPQAFGLSELSSYYDKGWSYLNKYTPKWEDGHYDPYPWAVLGFVAAKRGESALAQAQMHSIESTFASNPALVTINELGFYQRMKSILAGKPDV